MTTENRSRQELMAEIESLRARLEESEETLRAIGNGEVDAFVVSGAEGMRVFTLKGAEQPYRILVETMNEAASKDLADQEPKVRDQVIMLLSSKSIQDLATMESKMALKADIIRRLNQILGSSKVLQVYFTEMVIQ